MAAHKKTQIGPRVARSVRIWGWSFSVLAIVVAFGLLAYQLYSIQITNGAYYRQLASAQQLKDSTIEAERGEIYDATGKTLASTSIVWNLSCDPKDSKGLYTTDKETGTTTLDTGVCSEVSAGVAKILTAGDGSNGSGVDTSSAEYTATYDVVYAAFSKITSQYRTLASRVELPVAQAASDFIKSYNAAHKGVSIVLTTEKTYKRNYPYGAFAASVIGFCDNSGVGTYGLEKSYQDQLAGIDGRSIGVQDAQGNEVANNNATEYAAQDGYNLVLTLDTNVQEMAERYLNEAIRANNVSNRGCCIVMNVKSGAVLAMATKPDFDPNDPYTVYDTEYLHALVEAEPELYAHYQTNEDGTYVVDALGNKAIDEEYDYTGTYRELQWKNKAITELYYPGSVFKVITAAAGLDSGKATLDTSFSCGGNYNVADRTYHCANRKAHGTQNMAMGLRNSCNIYFIQLAQSLGAGTFFDYFNSFGFTEATGVDLPYETHYMQYYTEKQLGDVELASSAFGQSMEITPLQMCTAVAACVNGGYLVTPYLVSEITDANGNTVQKTQTTVKRQIVSSTTSDELRQIMEYEVGDGTNTDGGYRAYVAGYRVGGKSGTSEQLNMDKRASDGDYKKVASFVAMFPADDPEYLVYIMLDDPNNASTDYSSILAAPVVGNIISEVAPYLGVATNGENLESETIKVPELVGQEWGNAQVELNRKGLKHRLVTGNADTTAALVTYQYPAAGTVVSGGTTVYLYINNTSGSQVTVPDVTGKSTAFAQQMLSAAGLNCLLQGDAGGTITAQDIAGGTSVEMGTVVTLQSAGQAADADSTAGADSPAAGDTA
ncbi:MAG: PASTA domain-containing protein [Faecalibacterium sp.]|jgi:stage V sporulation protein D (sporulation-specific penicillin-binding protein)|nr:PASTA domain-containing protein [Faecalibacterium sp.]